MQRQLWAGQGGHQIRATSEGQGRSASLQGYMQRHDDPPPGQNGTAGTPGLLIETGTALFEAFFCFRDKGGIIGTELSCLQPTPAILTTPRGVLPTRVGKDNTCAEWDELFAHQMRRRSPPLWAAKEQQPCSQVATQPSRLSLLGPWGR